MIFSINVIKEDPVWNIKSSVGSIAIKQNTISSIKVQIKNSMRRNRYPETLSFGFNRVILTKPAHSYLRESSVSMTPLIRPNINLKLKDEGENKPLGSARASTHTQNTNTAFAPPQEAKEIFIDKNEETKFDNYINASYCNSSEHLKLFIAATAPKQNTAADFM